MTSPLAETPRAVLLLSCPDSRGIVAEVSQFIYAHNGNIIHSSQHEDEQSSTFFMRIEWDISDFSLPAEKIGASFEPLAVKFEMSYSLEFSDKVPRLAILVSKQDHCLFDLLLRNTEGEIEGEIALIVSNHRDHENVAEWFGIPFYHFPVTKETKHDVEREQIELLKRERIDLVVLARYMQILSSQFVEAFPNRIINIHHSFLPAFVGAKPYHQAFERGVKIIGATSHYVTEDLDQGPIIEQDVTRVSHRDTVEAMVQKGKNLEKLVLARAVKLHVEHRVLAYRNKTVVFE
ncbi:MAG: formyltetrahydrofolate deformylase [Spirochaetes bacterium]|jgi:formyltetrahydrofolate deformylase|nr:formyltetrahydrofolate deformylase [Spirochaetota bacterium]